MDLLTIRNARTSDLEQLYTFEQGVISAERPFDPTLKDDPVHYYNLPEMITAPHIELAVAEWENSLIGCGYARLEKSKPYLKHSHHAYHGFMYVIPEFRGRGINKKIMEYLAGWSKAQGVNELRLDVYAGNKSAIRAYEKTGFSKHMIEMRLGL